MKTDKEPTLGPYVRARRLALDMSLDDAAEASGLHRSYWSKLENGVYEAPSPRYLQVIAHAIDLPFEDLFGLAGYDSPKRLPSFSPYLRAKYQLPPEAVRDLEKYFELLRNHYGIPKDQPVFPPKEKKPPKPDKFDPPQEMIDDLEAA